MIVFMLVAALGACKQSIPIVDADLKCFKLAQTKSVAALDSDCQQTYAEKSFAAPDYEMWFVRDVKSEFADLFKNSVDNPDVRDWDVARSTTMAGMFQNATNFNRSLANWNVKGVRSFERFLQGATSYNNAVTLNAPACTTFASMFKDATSFNQKLVLSGSRKTRTSYEALLAGATAFNDLVDIAYMTSVGSIAHLFDGATSFNQPLEWNALSHDVNFRNVLRGAAKMQYAVGCWNLSFEVGDVETQCPASTSVPGEACTRCKAQEPVQASPPNPIVATVCFYGTMCALAISAVLTRTAKEEDSAGYPGSED